MPLLVFALLLIAGLTYAGSFPAYKPSSRAPAPVDIRTNAYGYSANAPAALRIGETAPDFDVPGPFGTRVSLADLTAKGPAVLVFYRGHW